MGGIGSGNWLRREKKTTINSQQTLDIRYLKKQGLLNKNNTGLLYWTSNGYQTGSASYQITGIGIKLNYKSRINNTNEWTEINSFIRFDFTACHYGGKRTWLLCPNTNCNRRVTSLYGTEAYFLCRHCHKLNYQSQHESHLDRQISKAHTIRTKLGGEAGLLTPFPDRPKGMHRKSYQKLYQQAMYGETCFLKNVKI